MRKDIPILFKINFNRTSSTPNHKSYQLNVPLLLEAWAEKKKILRATKIPPRNSQIPRPENEHGKERKNMSKL